MSTTKEYSNGNLTVVWNPEACIHSAICAKGLPEVFKPKERPWVNINAASTKALINQVNQCPSGALGYRRNGKGDEPSEIKGTKVVVLKDGPILVHGTLKITHKDGSQETKNNITAFCRCGTSNNKPFCDGTHVNNGFKG